MSAVIRRANENDIEGILKLLVQVDMVHHNGRPDIFKGPATKYNSEELKSIIENDATPVFVCAEDDKILGHAFCVHKQVVGDSVLTDIRTLYIDDICVDEECRGKHVGTRLFDAVKEYAHKNGFYNLTLNVWSCNPGAQKFYEKLGLVPQKVGMEMLING
ncbi:MAG: GNAT family N-acetyltransferase [Lachnospiraceae bacterium]|nr:GNAT family N-acetyltransferase [Lachnospiraceae bacterium]